MQKIVFLGAGQMGQAALALLNEENYKLLAFGDNKVTGSIAGKKILPVTEALNLQPNIVVLTVTGQEREAALAAQVAASNFKGTVVKLSAWQRVLDIRKAVLQKLVPRLAVIPGAIAELGVYQGVFAACLNELFSQRTLYLFDTFTGFTERDVVQEKTGNYSRAQTGDFSDTDEVTVLKKMPFPQQVRICKGYFPTTAQDLKATFALVSLDADLYAPTLAGLSWFWPRLAPGGCLILHDWSSLRFKGVKKAFDVFEKKVGRIPLLPVGDLHGTALLMKA